MEKTGITAIIAAAVSVVTTMIALYKARSERRKLEAEREEVETRSDKATAEAFKITLDAVSDKYSHMLQDQLTAVVEPMKDRIDKLEKRVKELTKQVDDLKQFENLFAISIQYIRQLCHWINLNPNLKHKGKPRLPKELAQYFKEGDLVDEKQ